MKVLRLLVYLTMGYFIGYSLGSCAQKVIAQTPINEIVQLNSNNTVVFRGTVNIDSVTSAELELARVVAYRGLKNYPIYLVLDSPGGELDSGSQLIEFAKIIPNLRTITIFAASMAALTVELLPGERLMTGNGMIMFHRAKGSIEGQIEVGEVETRLAMIKAFLYGIDVKVAARLKLQVADYKAKIKDEMWLDHTTATKMNAIDKVIDINCSEELVNKRIKAQEMTFVGPIEESFSGCPTLRGPIPDAASI